MANSVVGKAFRINQTDYFNCPKDVAVNCENAVAEGVVWFIPTSRNGAVTGYQQRMSSTKPTPDSVKTIRVKDFLSGTVYFILINDDDTISEFTDRCSACCDEQTAMDAVVVPPPVIEEDGCIEEAGDDYTYTAVAPEAGAGEVYTPSGSKNGVAFTPAAPTAGFSSIGAMVTWMNSNWSAYGSFAASGQTVTFSSSDAVTGSLNVTTYAAPIADAGPDQSGVGATGTLDGTGSTAGSGTLSYLWVKTSGPAGGTITSPTAATTGITALVTGTYVYTLTVTDSYGPTDTDTVSIAVT